MTFRQICTAFLWLCAGCALIASPLSAAVLQPLAASESNSRADNTTDVAGSADIRQLDWVGGEITAFTVRDERAYVNEGMYLIILDISDPTHIHELGRSSRLPAVGKEVDILGTIVYLLDQNGELHLFDTADPTKPIERKPYVVQDPIAKMQIVGKYIYLAAGNSGLIILDGTDPAEPVYVGGYFPMYGVTDVYIAENIIYIYGFAVLDVTDPSHPVRLAEDRSQNRAKATADACQCKYTYVEENRIYIATVDPPYYSQPETTIHIYDNTDPAKPDYLGSFVANWAIEGIVVRDSIAYLTDSYYLNIVDLSDPTSPILLHEEFVRGGIPLITDKRLYMAGESLSVWDITEEESPIWIGEYGATYDFWTVDSTAQFALFSTVTSPNQNVEMRIVDLAPGSNYPVIGRYQLDNKSIMSLLLDGSLVYVVTNSYFGDKPYNLLILDVSELSHPIKRGEYRIDKPINQMIATDNRLYLSSSNDLIIMDTSQLDAPTVIKQYSTSLQDKAMALANLTLFVATRYNGMIVYDVSDPENLKQIGKYPSQSPYADVTRVRLLANHAYVETHYSYPIDGNYLEVLDVTDPSNPAVERKYSIAGGLHAVGTSGHNTVAYLSDLLVLDVSDTSSSFATAYYDTAVIKRIEVRDSHIYLNAEHGGMSILDHIPSYRSYMPLVLR